MLLRYHDLVGKEVVGADGGRIGHVADLVAQRRGAALRVTALRVGPSALARRITFRVVRRAPIEVPWELVTAIDHRHIYLSIDRDALAALGQRAPDSVDLTEDEA